MRRWDGKQLGPDGKFHRDWCAIFEGEGCDCDDIDDDDDRIKKPKPLVPTKLEPVE
jgi:hypothetical protein